MEAVVQNTTDLATEKDAMETLFSYLDKGIDDMEAGKELPLDDAFQKIRELRDNRRSARA